MYVQKLLSFCLLSENWKIETGETINLPVCVWLRNLVSHTEGSTEVEVFQNSVQKRSFNVHLSDTN
jgi:hypothetical protein